MRKRKIKLLKIRLRFLEDVDGNQLGVLLSIKDYRKVLDCLKEREDRIKEYEFYFESRKKGDKA